MRWSSRSAALLAALCALAPAARAQRLDSLVVRLANMSAVSGLEDAMADSLLAALPGAAPDRAGNVVWTRGSGAPVRVALCPMDELGYVVGSITPDGYLTLRRVGTTPVGPLFDQALEGQRVTVFGRHGPVPGVVGVRSIHLTRGRPAGSDEPFPLDDAFVDVGASSAADAAQLGIELLAPVTRAKAAHRYGLDLVAAPDASARAACAALLDAALASGPGGGEGTAVVAFTRRRHFRWDGAAFLLSDRTPAGTQVVVLGDAGPTDSLDLGAAPARADSLFTPDGWRATVTWSLPTRYAGSSVETVSLRDVATLSRRLRRFLEGTR